MKSRITTGLAAVALLVCASAAFAVDWPQWMGPKRDGSTPEVPKKLPGEAKPLWKKPVAGPCYSGIVAVGDKVVVVDHQSHTDDTKGKDIIRCLKASDGTELWTYSYPNERTEEDIDYGPAPRATPIVHDGMVFSLGAAGDLVGLKLEDGKKVWDLNFVKDFDAAIPMWGYSSSPLVADGKLIVNPGGAKAAVVALDPKTGKPVWTAKGGDANYASFIAPTVAGTRQVIGYSQWAITGRKVKDGSTVWEMDVGNPEGYIVPSPVYADGKLYLANTDGTYAFPFDEKGKLKDTPVADFEYFAMENDTPVALGEMLLACSDGEGFMAASLDNLKELWLKDEADGVAGFGSIMVHGNRALVFASSGHLHLFEVSKKDAKLLGSLKLSSMTHAAPALANGHIFVRDNKSVYGYKLGEPAKADAKK